MNMECMKELLHKYGLDDIQIEQVSNTVKQILDDSITKVLKTVIPIISGKTNNSTNNEKREPTVPHMKEESAEKEAAL